MIGTSCHSLAASLASEFGASMSFITIDPATGRTIARHPTLRREDALRLLGRSRTAFARWRETTASERARLLRSVGRILRRDIDKLSRLITAEMGKPLAQSRAEIEKCAFGCDYYAKHGPSHLGPRQPPHAPESARVVFDPLGVVLAIMPWNFPFWQSLRAAAPALLAGNTFLLKPAPSTAGCGLALEGVFKAAGAPPDVFRTILVETDVIETLIADPRLAAVTLTGSTGAGKSVAALAGAAMKPATFELGGSDAYLIFDDADLVHAAEVCAESRLINSGQSCIAAKRFIVLRSVQRDFEQRFVSAIARRHIGIPTDPETNVGPMARADLRSQLHRQVQRSIRLGARALLRGGPLPGPGFFYAPTVLTDVKPGMPAHDDELFGPAAAIIGARDEREAIAIANASRYGLGAAVFTRNRSTARRVAAQLEAGTIAINNFVSSDPALPFGGVKDSGFGRELGEWGTHAFVNVKTIID